MTEELRPGPTETTVKWAIGTVSAELAGLSGARTRRWTADMTEDGGLLIRKIKNRGTKRIITASPGIEGSLIPEARITVLDVESGELINEGPRPRRILRDAVRQIFPDRAAIRAEVERSL